MITNIRLFFEFIVRLFQYIPYIWRDRDFDYIFILKMLQYKLKRTRLHLVKHGIIADAKQTGEKIRRLELVLDRILNDNYCELDYDMLKNKWGKYENNGDIIYGRTNIKTEADRDMYYKEVLTISKQSAYLENQDYEYFFKQLKRNIRTFWD